MKLSELMQGYTPQEDFEGWVTNDDFVLAINTGFRYTNKRNRL